MTKETAKSRDLRGTIALIVSIFALTLSLIGIIRDYFYEGSLVVFPPTGFCVVRGYEDTGFPSDHLVMPFVIENTGNGVKTMQVPVLDMRERNSESRRKFEMAGTLPDLYSKTMDDSYQTGFSISVPGNSVREYYLVFNVEDWWDDTNPDAFNFNFNSGEEWQASLEYWVNGKMVNWQDGADRIFLEIPIYPTVDNMEFGGEYNADCFSINPSPSEPGK